MVSILKLLFSVTLAFTYYGKISDIFMQNLEVVSTGFATLVQMIHLSQQYAITVMID